MVDDIMMHLLQAMKLAASYSKMYLFLVKAQMLIASSHVPIIMGTGSGLQICFSEFFRGMRPIFTSSLLF